MSQDFVVDFITQIADENMEVVRSILLAGAVGLVCPVDTDFLGQLDTAMRYHEQKETYRLVDPATIQGLHSPLGRTWVIELNETVIVALGGELPLE